MGELLEKVRYEADISQITAKLDELEKKQGDVASAGEDSGGRISGAFGKVGGVLGTAAKAVGVGILSIAGAGAVFGPMILDQGASLDALQKKSATVFEGSLASVQSWAAGTASSLGMTNEQLVGTAAGIADLLKPMGFTADAAAGMSTQVLDLAGALSAWTGGQMSAKDVSDVLAKAYLGERDGLKALGISISDADVQARLARDGKDKLTGAALEQAKALATQQLIMEKSTDAQKAWSDGSMDSIKAQNESKASIAQLKQALIQGLYPAFQAILPVIKNVASWLADHIPAAIALAKEAWAKIQDGFQWLLDNKPVLIGAMAAIGVVVVGAFGAWAISAGSAAVATIAATWPVLAIAAAVAALAAGFVYAYQHVDWFRNAVDAVGRFFRDTFWPILQDVFGWLRDHIPPIIGAVVDWFQTLWTKTEGIRSFLAGAFKLAIDVVITEIQLWWAGVQTLADWLQTAWDKTEGLRSLVASGFSLALDAIKTTIDGVWGAVQTMADWLQTAWDKTETLRSLIAGGFSLALSGLQGAFGAVKAVIQPIYDLLVKTWGVMQDVLGGGVTGKIAPGAFGPTGTAGSKDAGYKLHTGGKVGVEGERIPLSTVPQRDEVWSLLQRDEFVMTPAQLEAVAKLGGGSGRGGGPVMHVEHQHIYSGVDAGAVAQRINMGLAS